MKEDTGPFARHVGTHAITGPSPWRPNTVDASSEGTIAVDLDGTSPVIERLKAHIRLVARDALVTVLILGESGTGKERVARAIHAASRRRAGPFVVVNCAGLSSTLIEDELFGHERGAFTGAVADRAGPFERAHGGTVFLDEIGELAPELQLRLLRALQQRTVQRLGARKEVAFDVQILAATNTDLARAVSRGRFREDLYYRLTVYELEVPAVRTRGTADLSHLTNAILKSLSAQRGVTPPPLDEQVWEHFVAHSWPGNVRELENTLERMLVAGGGASMLTMKDLPGGFGASHRTLGEQARVRRRPVTAADIHEAFDRSGRRRGQAAAALGLSRHQEYRLRRRLEPPRHAEST